MNEKKFSAEAKPKIVFFYLNFGIEKL